jgi:hypothetical protein
MNHSYIACWKDIQEYGPHSEEQQVALIKVSLLTVEQAQWLVQNYLTVEDLLNGRYRIDLESAIHQRFYKPWNDTLERNGLKRSFSEDEIGQAMLDSIQNTLQKPFKFI